MRGNGLAAALASAIQSSSNSLRPEGPPLTCFYDQKCLDDGEELDVAVSHGLSLASLMVVVVSQGVVDALQFAPRRRDSNLLQWECITERLRMGDCLCLPVFVGDVRYTPSEIPDAGHYASGISVRASALPILCLPSVTVGAGSEGGFPAADLERAAATACGMLQAGDPSQAAPRRATGRVRPFPRAGVGPDPAPA